MQQRVTEGSPEDARRRLSSNTAYCYLSTEQCGAYGASRRSLDPLQWRKKYV